MSKTIIIGLIAIVIIGAGGYLVLYKNSTSPPVSSSTQGASSSNSSNDKQNVAATITYSGSGFSPKATTVKSGDKVAINNTSSRAVQFDSDPHPSHTDDGDLNVGTVGAGQIKTFTVTKTGTFGIHNHLNPNETAQITIK
ncbi:hypothetical protein A3F37_03585 [Candidatus Saccharibacteria bacterium RIFCSPHIGHO2_12_FULL_41_12]|nr:MAG: hypothetical protein A3F37_03585 [Candidatus Saccharibacteria bacterium RIFCSPHIGHO2_12_FULL_41_12]